MEQLNLFEIPVKTVVSTQSAKIIDFPTPTPERVTESKGIIESGLAPTWEIHYYDKAKRSRIDWVRSENEEDARPLLREKVKDNVLFIDRVQVSKRTLEEIELLD